MYEVKMPRLGVTMQNGIITDWLVEEGDQVEKGDYLFELESEKSNLEIEAQASGILKKILVPVGEEVSINTVVAIIAGPDEEVDLSSYAEQKKEASAPAEEADQPKPAMASETAKNRKGGVSPKARKLAKELGVSLDGIAGTGKDGIVTEDDVRNASETTASSSSAATKSTVPLSAIQKAMAENMVNSWQNVPQFTQIVSVDMSNVMSAKKELGDVSLNDLMIKAVAKAAKKHPFINSRLENGKEIVLYDEVNVSVAVSSSHGLVVPVVKQADTKSVQDISAEVKQLAERAGNKNLSADDFANGTITVSNLGSFGIESGTPIINPPQGAIVFAGAITKTPVVAEDDTITIKPIMKLSICYDHRFIDGVTGARFTNEVKETLETMTAETLAD